MRRDIQRTASDMGDVALRTCPACKDRLVVFQVNGQEVAFGSDGEQHECWDIPEGADLLVLDD